MVVISSSGNCRQRFGQRVRFSDVNSTALLSSCDFCLAWFSFPSRVHVWDINRPFIPLLSFKGHRDVVTGFHWLNEGGFHSPMFPMFADGTQDWVIVVAGSLLTVSKDKFVILHSCADAFRPQTTLPPAAVAVSSTEIAWVIDQVDRTSSPSQFASRKPTGHSLLRHVVLCVFHGLFRGACRPDSSIG